MKPVNELRKVREEKGLSMEQVSENTKISVDKIRAMEQGNFDYFSGKFYAKNFLKTYAGYLGIPVNSINIFEHENSILSSSQNQGIVTSRKTGVKIWLIIIGIAVVASLILLYTTGKPGGIKPEKFSAGETAVTPTDTVIMVKGVTNKPTWVRVVADSVLVEETTLGKSVTKYWKAKNSLKIRIGYTKGINIFYRKSPDKEYTKIDIEEGSIGEVNEIEFLNDFSK